LKPRASGSQCPGISSPDSKLSVTNAFRRDRDAPALDPGPTQDPPSSFASL
jgi:hypothetical protein